MGSFQQLFHHQTLGLTCAELCVNPCLTMLSVLFAVVVVSVVSVVNEGGSSVVSFVWIVLLSVDLASFDSTCFDLN